MPRKAQSIFARVAIVAWFWAAILLPLSHTWEHQLDHVHGPFGVIPLLMGDGANRSRFADEHVHSHGGHSHEHGGIELAESSESAPENGDDEEPIERHSHPAGDHGSGSAEHAQATLWFSLAAILPAGFSHFLATIPSRVSGEIPLLAAARWIERSRAPPQGDSY